MEMKEYFQNKIDSAVNLAKVNTEDAVLVERGNLVERPIVMRMMGYANTFLEGKGDSRMVIMYGLRGIGKSTVLFQIYNRLRKGQIFDVVVESKKVLKENILYLSVDQTLLEPQFQQSKSPIFDAVKSFCEDYHGQKMELLDKKLFVMIDEAQFDKNWAFASKSIFDITKNIFIIITGSSALALNIDTDTARRAIKEPLFPLNLMEYETMKNRIFPLKGTGINLKELVLQGKREMIPNLNETVKAVSQKMKSKEIKLDNELQDYLTMGGFPIKFTSTKDIMYRKLVDMINRITSQDLFAIANYESDTIPQIMRIIGAIALKPPGELGQTKLASSLGISSSKVNSIIESLEKAHLIYLVKPYPAHNYAQGLSRGYKYYFMSPTLLSALQYLNGRTTITPQQQGLLWENAVASSLFKLCYTTGTVYNLYYDPRNDGNVDFILQNPLLGNVIPLEVGLTKDQSQIKDAVDYYKATYGIVISDFETVEVQQSIIKIPFWLFLYL
jgi:predicted AAA+ superfamily ATPase